MRLVAPRFGLKAMLLSILAIAVLLTIVIKILFAPDPSLIEQMEFSRLVDSALADIATWEVVSHEFNRSTRRSFSADKSKVGC